MEQVMGVEPTLSAWKAEVIAVIPHLHISGNLSLFAVSKHYLVAWYWVDFEVLRLTLALILTGGGTPYKSRTCSLRIRSPSLYPIELMVHIWRPLQGSNL